MHAQVPEDTAEAQILSQRAASVLHQPGLARVTKDHLQGRGPGNPIWGLDRVTGRCGNPSRPSRRPQPPSPPSLWPGCGQQGTLVRTADRGCAQISDGSLPPPNCGSLEGLSPCQPSFHWRRKSIQPSIAFNEFCKQVASSGDSLRLLCPRRLWF